MRPDEYPPEDRSLYFQGTFMHHETRGVVYVQIADRAFHGRTSDDQLFEQMEPDQLSCLTPSPRAINIGSSAYYVSRRATRSAKRSATTGGYRITDPARGYRDNPTRATFYHFAREGEEYPAVDEVIDLLGSAKNKAKAKAVSRDFIIHKPNISGQSPVSYKGMIVGVLSLKTREYKTHTLGSLGKRAERKFKELLNVGSNS